MIWWILLILFLMVLSWLLFAPVRLYINTSEAAYQLTYGPVLGVYLVPQGFITDWRIRFKVLFFKFSFRIGDMGQKRMEKKKRKKEIKKDRKTQKKRSPRKLFQMMRRILKTFEIQVCRLEIDTGDVMWNAYLFPVSALLNRRKNIDINVNYDSRNSLEFLLENRAYRLAWAFIRQ